jgi:hypothetical protein
MNHARSELFSSLSKGIDPNRSDSVTRTAKFVRRDRMCDYMNSDPGSRA